MSDTCKLCGKKGLDWGCDKDGDYGLINRSGTMHVCVDYLGVRKSSKSKRKREYLKAVHLQNEMDEYVTETRGPMHLLNAAGCNNRHN